MATVKPAPPAELLDVSKCPNVRHDLCGALGANQRIRNGDRVVNSEGRILCFTQDGDVQSGLSGGPVLQSLALSDDNAMLVMQGDGNLVYYGRNQNSWKPKWAFNTARGAGCPLARIPCASLNSSCPLPASTATVPNPVSPSLEPRCVPRRCRHRRRPARRRRPRRRPDRRRRRPRRRHHRPRRLEWSSLASRHASHREP